MRRVLLLLVLVSGCSPAPSFCSHWCVGCKTCVSTDDCDPGTFCVEVTGRSGDARCLPRGECGSDVQCLWVPPSCHDANRLERDFCDGHFFGRELIACPNGCDPGGRDAGPTGGAARCR